MKNLVSSVIAIKLYGINIFTSSIDEIIDEFRIKHNIVIYNTASPFVESTGERHNILFSYTVKKCYPGKANGWNHRVYIYTSEWMEDPWEAKMKCIEAALEYVETRAASNTMGKSVPYF